MEVVIAATVQLFSFAFGIDVSTENLGLSLRQDAVTRLHFLRGGSGH